MRYWHNLIIGLAVPLYSVSGLPESNFLWHTIREPFSKYFSLPRVGEPLNSSVSVGHFLEKQEGDQPIQEIGQLDITPAPQTFSGSVSGSQPNDYYHFSLQATSTVNLRLSGLTSAANLFIGDENSNLITKSTNPNTNDETIALNLEPGNYIILVRGMTERQTAYTLRLQAEFIIEDIIVSTIGEPVRDPEFDVVGDRVAWIDDSDRLLVAPVDPQTGLFLMDQQTVVDQGLAPFLEDGIQNGPEWAYSQDGSSIVYTLLINNEWYLGRARQVDSLWEAGPLEDSLNGHVPFGSLNPTDEVPLIKYSLGSPTIGPRRATAWRELDNPASEAIITGPGATGGRWIEGERALTFSVQDEDGFAQIARYDVDTAETTILTSGSTNKGRSFAWHAPELDGELVFMATESNPANPLSGSSVGIYRKINGAWRKIKTIQPPSENKYVGNTDFFVFDGKSYVLLQMLPKLVGNNKIEGAEIWIAGFNVSGDQDFYRKVTDGNVLRPNDPEHFATESQVFVYYTDATGDGGVIHRANTGLSTQSPAVLNRKSNHLPQKITLDKSSFSEDGALSRFLQRKVQPEIRQVRETYNTEVELSKIELSKVEPSKVKLPNPQSFWKSSSNLKQRDTEPSIQRLGDDVILASVSDSFLGNARDVYYFRILEESNINLHLFGLSVNAKLTLRDKEENPLLVSDNFGTQPEAIAATLEAGDYSIVVEAEQPSRSTYDLAFASLENIPTKQSTLVEYVIPPQATDPNMSEFHGNHYIAIDSGVEPKNALFVFFPGAKGQPLRNRLIVQEAASQGYHSIGLAYPNEEPVTRLCYDDVNGNCYHQVRQEILKGVNQSRKVEVTRSDSLENRLIQLLKYLDTQFPAQGWSDYLEDDAPKWESILVSGHSMGGTQAAFIAKFYEVAKVILFANEVENNLAYQYYAPWLSIDSVTPTERYVGFMHQEDRFAARLHNWNLLGLEASQEIVNVDDELPPYNSSARLFTAHPPAIADKFHEAVIVDDYTPKNADGSPLYSEVWEYLLEE